MVNAASESILGRRPKMGVDPIPVETENKLKDLKRKTQELLDGAREEQHPERSKQLLKESRAKGREHRKLLRSATHKQWDGVISRLELAEGMHDSVSFHKELDNLKLLGAPAVQRVRFSPEVLREHFSAIGAEENVTDDAAWDEMESAIGENQELDLVPEEAEIWANLSEVRESAPGPDGVTVEMISHGGRNSNSLWSK